MGHGNSVVNGDAAGGSSNYTRGRALASEPGCLQNAYTWLKIGQRTCGAVTAKYPQIWTTTAMSAATNNEMNKATSNEMGNEDGK